MCSPICGDFNTEFRCDPSSYSRTTTPLVGVCNTTEARLHIDWIFRTPSARTSYQARRTEGLLPFEAAKAAQGHNPSARASIAACPNWASSYLAGLDSSNGSEVLAGRQLTAADCRCVSIRPSDSSTTMGNLAFTVRGNCDLMRVTVNFSGQLMSSWTRPVTVGNGRRETVSAPNTGDISVASYRLQNAAGEFTCRVERAPQSTMAP